MLVQMLFVSLVREIMHIVLARSSDSSVLFDVITLHYALISSIHPNIYHIQHHLALSPYDIEMRPFNQKSDSIEHSS